MAQSALVVSRAVAMEFDVDLSGFDELLNNLATLYPDAVADEIYATMELSLGVFEQAVKLETPVNTGNLRGSIATEITGTPANMTGLVVTPLLYGWPVERGRQPGTPPPVGPIELWVIRKGLEWTYKTKSGKVRPMTTRQMAFIIARSIGKKGTSGAAMFYKGFQAALPAVERLWLGLPDRVVKRIE